MKHGLNLLALLCWMAGAAFASETGPQVLTPDQCEVIEGGDLYLAVNRDNQMMTVTRVTPGNYGNTEAYSVKVTTSVVRNSDVDSSTSKGAMVNNNRPLGSSDVKPLPAQFPTGTAKLTPTTSTSPQVQGPVIKTNAAPTILAQAGSSYTTYSDSGYNIHYVDPAKSTNTLGCIGVQSESSMTKLVNTLNTDNATYSNPSQAKQTVTVSAYSKGSPPPASTFAAQEKKPTPPPAPVPAPVVTPPSTPWWKFW